MTKKKLKVGILFGGKSPEHEVSVVSAGKVRESLGRKKYIVVPIKIRRDGKFNLESLKKFDVVFPVLHGPFGEDGTIQGLLKLIGIPFVGASVLGSAVGMDKDTTKRLLKEAKITIAKFITLEDGEKINFSQAVKKLGLPMFVKPSNMGSSVGVSKIENKTQFEKALKLAFRYDRKVVIEEAVMGREIECAVIGNEWPIVSLPGEIVPEDKFYTYKAKYDDTSGTNYIVPVKLPKKIKKKIQQVAVQTYKVLSCEGMGRVDMFLKKNGEVLVNEINTIPGPVMFRRLWEVSGIPFSKLLDKLIDFSLERFKKEQKLRNTHK